MKESEVELFELNLDSLYKKNKISDGLYFFYKMKIMYYRFLLKFVDGLKDTKGLEKEGD